MKNLGWCAQVRGKLTAIAHEGLELLIAGIWKQKEAPPDSEEELNSQRAISRSPHMPPTLRFLPINKVFLQELHRLNCPTLWQRPCWHACPSCPSSDIHARNPVCGCQHPGIAISRYSEMILKEQYSEDPGKICWFSSQKMSDSLNLCQACFPSLFFFVFLLYFS